MQARRLFLAALWSLMAAPLVARVSGASSPPPESLEGSLAFYRENQNAMDEGVNPIPHEPRKLVGFSGGQEEFAWVELVYSDGGKAVLYLRTPATAQQIMELRKDLRTQKAWELFGKDVYAIRLGEDPELDPTREVRAGREYIELHMKLNVHQ